MWIEQSHLWLCFQCSATPMGMTFFPCHNGTFLVVTFQLPIIPSLCTAGHTSKAITLWHSRAITTGTPCREVTAVGLEYGRKTKGTSPPEETAAVLQIRSSYKFSQELHLIAHIAFQSSDAHAIDWHHHTALHPTCCWVCASGKDLKLGLE